MKPNHSAILNRQRQTIDNLNRQHLESQYDRYVNHMIRSGAIPNHDYTNEQKHILFNQLSIFMMQNSYANHDELHEQMQPVLVELGITCQIQD